MLFLVIPTYESAKIQISNAKAYSRKLFMIKTTLMI